MSNALYSGVSGLALGVGLYRNVSGLWGGASGLVDGFDGGTALYLDFLSGVLDPRITFSRGSTATFVGSNGLIQTAAINTPRFDYDPVTLAPKGLLIEEQRTNLTTYSDQFDNAAWTKTRSTVSANATTAPDGTTSADKLVEDTTATSTHFVSRTSSIVISASTAYSGTVFIKSAERTIARLRIIIGGSAFAAETNLTTGAISAVAGEVPTSFSATSYGNGWWRIVVSGTSGAGTSGDIIIQLCNAAGSNSYTGDGTSGLFIWGAQLEAGAFATSYIPTVAAQVTRSADAASMTGTNFSSWFNGTAGTFAINFDAFDRNGTIATVSDGTSSNRFVNYPANSTQLDIITGGVNQGSLGGGAISLNTATKLAYAYATNDAALSLSGGAVVTDTSLTLPSVNQMRLGASSGGGALLNGHIQTLTYYNSRLSNTQLQALTT